jgi:hypothetical protein
MRLACAVVTHVQTQCQSLKRHLAKIASFETAPEKMAPPQDERKGMAVKQFAAHPEEAAPEQARFFRAVSKGSQRPSRRVPASLVRSLSDWHYV